MIKTRPLTSLFLSAMLTSSFIPSATNPVLASPVDAAFGRAALESAIEGMRAEGFHASAPREWPAAPAPSRTAMIDPATTMTLADPALTEDAFQRLKAIALASTVLANYNGKVSALLGLTKGEPLPNRQYGYQINGIRHGFLVSTLNNDDVLIMYRTADTITTILTDSTRTIRSAVIYVRDQEPRAAPASEVEAIFTAELKFWAKTEANPPRTNG